MGAAAGVAATGSICVYSGGGHCLETRSGPACGVVAGYFWGTYICFDGACWLYFGITWLYTRCSTSSTGSTVKIRSVVVVLMVHVGCASVHHFQYRFNCGDTGLV